MNRLTRAVPKIEAKLKTLPAATIDHLIQTTALSLAELCVYQERKSLAMLEGKITQDEAQTLYHWLGNGGIDNGWPKRTTLAQRLVATQAMAEILGVAR